MAWKKKTAGAGEFKQGDGEGFSPKTPLGYEMFEASSALQKAIRRGDEEQAMYWTVELWNGNYQKYIWKRLRIITAEDVGLAEPGMPAAIYALWQMYEEQIKKNDGVHFPERLFLTQAVLMLCRAKKSRLVDWTLVTYWRGHEDMKVTMPDHVFDKHTRKGRQMGRGWDYHFDVGTHLENMAVIEGEAEMKARTRKVIAMEESGKKGKRKADIEEDDAEQSQFPF